MSDIGHILEEINYAEEELKHIEDKIYKYEEKLKKRCCHKPKSYKEFVKRLKELH